LHGLLFALSLKAATVIVSGSVGASSLQDLMLVGIGTGVVVDRLDATHYAVVTAAHVARYGNPQVAFFRHARAHSRVEMAMLDPAGDDLAVLIVRSDLHLPVLPLAANAPRAGEHLTVVGHPYAHAWSVTHATYAQNVSPLNSVLRPLVTRDSTLWICRGCDRGNSGSGIYDARNRLVALVYAAAPLRSYAAADARELHTDTYDPRIVRQVLAVDAHAIRTFLRRAEHAWRRRESLKCGSIRAFAAAGGPFRSAGVCERESTSA